MTTKAIPAEPQFEISALDCILMDPALMKIAVDEVKLLPEHFFSQDRGIIYRGMTDLYREGLEVESIALQAAVEKYSKTLIASYSGETISTLNARAYFVAIKKAAFKRQKLITLASKVAELAYGDQPIDDDISDVQMLASALDSNRESTKIVTFKDLIQRSINKIDLIQQNGMAAGVPTGFTMLDRILGGLQKGLLYTLGARPAMGKSSLALNIIVESAKRYGTKGAFFGLEMTCEQLVNRILSMETGIDVSRINRGEINEEAREWELLLDAANRLAQLKIHIDDTPAARVSDIRTKAKQLMAEDGLDLIVIDYMQLMTSRKGTGENRQQEISEISRDLKTLARELDIPIVALSQLSRAVEARSDKRPMLSDLRESGSVEQDSDVVLFIYREDYYIEDTDRQNIADIIVAKHRNGATGTISLYFRKELTSFRDLEIQRTEFR